MKMAIFDWMVHSPFEKTFSIMYQGAIATPCGEPFVKDNEDMDMRLVEVSSGYSCFDII